MKIRHTRYYHIVVRDCRNRRRPGQSIGMKLYVVFLARETFLQHPCQGVCESDLGIAKCRAIFLFPLPVICNHLSFRIIPCAAILAYAVTGTPAVVRRYVENIFAGISLDLLLDLQQPLIPDCGIGIAELRSIRTRKPAPGAVRLECKIFRMAF